MVAARGYRVFEGRLREMEGALMYWRSFSEGLLYARILNGAKRQGEQHQLARVLDIWHKVIDLSLANLAARIPILCDVMTFHERVTGG